MDEEAKELATRTEQLVEIAWGKIETWLTTLAEMLPNLIVAVLIVVVAALMARLFANLVRRAAERAASNAQVVSLLTVITRLSVLALGVFVALGILQLDKTVTSLLAGIGVVGLALGFAFQDIAANFMSGVIMAVREPFRLGDLIETHGTMGNVRRVTLRATVVENFSGQLVMIPNKDVLQSPITNFSQSGKRRIEVLVGVSYADDLQKAVATARAAIEGVGGRDAAEPLDVFYVGFGDSSIDLAVRFWIDLTADDANYPQSQSDAIMAIKKAFDEAGISIPFPIRTLELAGTEREALTEALGRTAASA